MARIKKKGKSGQAKNFITRSQAVRKLQVSLPDFRRLCIFKGIYPREPRHKKKAFKSSTPSTTFYYTKDIQYLLHEPLLQKFRDHKSLAKKIGRALGRGEVSDAARLERIHKPRISLDHIIKERYPTFVDALRDLDDALSMLFLFASLPSSSNIPPKTIALCQRLCHEFQHYLIITHSLRKSFLSIKGIYYQATIQGQDILWVVPYKFVQRVTSDIDLRIMGTFVEFYTTLLGFVNFRLYTTIGLVYPPKFDATQDEKGAELGAFTLEGRDIVNPEKQVETVTSTSAELEEATAKAQAAADELKKVAPSEGAQSVANGASADLTENEIEGAEENNGIDTFAPVAADSDALPQPIASRNEAGSLFASFTFYLSRETPRAPLEFLLKAFGCKRVAWDAVLGEGAFTHNESDPAITHQIVDRPPQPVDSGVPQENSETDTNIGLSQRGHRVPGRIYIQPQWVWDCINQGKLQRPDLYAPGATLPPHLSPWVRPSRGEYDPTAPLDDDEDEIKNKDTINGVDSVKAIADLNGDDVSVSEEDDDDEEENEEDDDTMDPDHQLAAEAAEEAGVGMDVEVDDFAGFDNSDGSDSDENEADARQRELEAEAAGQKPPSASISMNDRGSVEKTRKKQKLQEEEELVRQKMMMPRRKRKLLEKMMYSNAKKDKETEKLKAKRRRLEAHA